MNKKTKDRSLKTFLNTIIFCLCSVFAFSIIANKGFFSFITFICGIFACNAFISIMNYLEEEDKEHEKELN